MNKAPTTLIIMDGFGLTDPGPGNAVSLAQTPQLDRLFAEYAHTTLSASGLDVGLPAGQMGNSEVGHTNIGGGRVVFQDLPRISRAIDDGSFFENAAYNKAMDDCLEKGSSLHLYGLLSDGGVHSHIQHLYALLQMARNKGLTRVYVHAFLDGRDVSPTSGKGFVADCQEKCRALGVGKIATVMGRYYAMDRDNRWERVQLAYDAMVYGEGIQNPDPVDAVAQSYENDVTDEFMEPVVCDPDGTISDNDSIIFFNFRPDRAREITRAIVDPEFDGFQREFFPTTYVCNTEYDASMPNVLVAWPRIPVKYLSAMGMTQLRIAETEKYAHVTFFFNGGVEKQYPGEDRVLVPSPKVATYDLQPEMSAYEVCDKCIERINSGAYDVIILNFANCDMVGHTGVLQAAVKAVDPDRQVNKRQSTQQTPRPPAGGVLLVKKTFSDTITRRTARRTAPSGCPRNRQRRKCRRVGCSAYRPLPPGSPPAAYPSFSHCRSAPPSARGPAAERPAAPVSRSLDYSSAPHKSSGRSGPQSSGCRRLRSPRTSW